MTVRSAADGSRLRVAVADGATESSYSAEWADALVRAWAETEDDLDEPLMSRASSDWERQLPARERLPWYTMERLAEGSHAAAAFLDVREEGLKVCWRAVVVGDCVVAIRRRGARSTVPDPLPRFGSSPDLLATAAPWGLGAAVRAGGRTARLDEMWLATDALAAALFSRGRRASWSDWRIAVESETLFAELVEAWRSRGFLRNDDATLVRVWRE